MNNVSIISSALVSVFVGIGAAAIGIVAGFFIFKLINAGKIGKSKSTAAKIIEEAYQEAKSVKKEAMLEAKEEVHKLRDECDNELKERRAELQKAEVAQIVSVITTQTGKGIDYIKVIPVN